MPEYAKDFQTGALIKASNASKQGKFVCLCPDKHAVFLRKGLERAAHFAHFSVEDGREVTCRGGGESEEHIEAKHRLVEMQGQYKFALKKCMECGESLWEDCGGDGKLDVEVRSLDKRWRYDVLLTRSDGTQLALEVYHTHATGGTKVESSALIGVPIAEFQARDILDFQAGGVLHNLQCDEKWICGDRCAYRKRLREEAVRMAHEKKMRETQEAARLEKKRREEQEAARLEKKRREEQEAADRMARERKRRLEEQEELDRKRRDNTVKYESHKPCKDEKLYYHCEFNGSNNTSYWAPLGEGVCTYGEIYKCGKVVAE
jgi:hypothetical protein